MWLVIIFPENPNEICMQLPWCPLLFLRRDIDHCEFGKDQPGGEHIVIGSLEGLAGQLLRIISPEGQEGADIKASS